MKGLGLFMYGAIILAAGSGTRFGNEKKQFYKFNGKALYEIVLDKVQQVISRKNIVVVGVDIEGGLTRSQSVLKGLQALSPFTERVIILEAARPLVTINQIYQILLDTHKSVSYVMPCVNTVIFRDGTYIDRNKVYDLLVPQCFDYDLLKRAYETGKYYDKTDETSVMFAEYHIHPFFIETTQNLYKVTYKRDISVLKEIDKLMKEGKI